MKKKANSAKKPCWLTCDQHGRISAWVYRNNSGSRPLLPKRLAPGKKSTVRYGFVGIEVPPLEEGEGRWEHDQFPKDVREYRFNPERSKEMFPKITWESEPVKATICFTIEIEE